MGTYEIFRHILNVQAYLDIIRHIQKLFRRIQAYKEPCASLTYSEPETNSEHGAYSEFCQTSTKERFAKIVNGYNYFR